MGVEPYADPGRSSMREEGGGGRLDWKDKRAHDERVITGIHHCSFASEVDVVQD